MPLDILALLAVALIAAKCLGGVFARFHLPTSVAELFAGSALLAASSPWLPFEKLQSSDIVRALSLLGLALLAFQVGLQSELREVFRMGRRLIIVAILWVVLPMAIFFLTKRVLPFDLGLGWLLLLVLGTVSIAIPSHALRRTGATLRGVVTVVLGIALISNGIGLVVGSIVTALTTAEGAAVSQKIVIVFAELSFFVIGIYFSRALLIPPVIRGLAVFGSPGFLTVVLTSLAVIASWLASVMVLAGAVGAFVLGLMLDHVVFQPLHRDKAIQLETLFDPLLDYLVPVLFVWLGLQLRTRDVLNFPTMKLAAIYCVMAVMTRMAVVLLLPRTLVGPGGRLAVFMGILSPGETGFLFLLAVQPLLPGSQYNAAALAIVVLTAASAIHLSQYGMRQAHA